ncbi:MocR-like pyridoxine biosynthesis transcription factor PdxR [Dactylosporangium aurantiacum]|uniref:MocR-like pyridoxine biosynthesis transcription factor PdxR n=1 Tax=Dactylosporangium aurantiacum TaxID=35754 RepID=UPI000526AE06|nr:PLP-dependent aminotransferase family protein [Dactylosporangium aurantiacum]MDG6101626.1 PLP-dependent aminotransferase family protein [Dactylosporangium aurantiacum]
MARERTNPELLVALDPAGGPLHRQLEAAIRAGIRGGRLVVGSALPSSRALAAALGVSRGVVVTAYEQLTAEGYLTSRSGGYTTIATGPAPAVVPGPAAVAPARISFGYGRTDVSRFPRAAWLRSVRRVLTTAPTDRLGYTSGQGTPELRAALAEYLNRVRGTDARPDTIVVCAGYAQAANLLIQVLHAGGATRLAVEDPSGEDDARPLAVAAGMTVTGVPVGPDGIDVTALAAVDADALVLTPSHQWPTGGVLPAAARAAVVRWAAARDALVVEDDYDAEYRYDRAAVGAMQGLAPDRVAYVGSASKTLAPGLRLGWMVLPAHLVAPVVAAKVLADRGSPALDQLTFADFLGSGEFDRHLRRMRPLYRRRRDTLLAALARHLPQLRPVGIAAGQHLVAWLPPGLAEEAVEAAALAGGLAVHGVGRFRLAPGPPGLLFGYGHLSEDAIEEGVAILAEALDGLDRR